MNQKWIALLLALILALSVCGCGNPDGRGAKYGNG